MAKVISKIFSAVAYGGEKRVNVAPAGEKPDVQVSKLPRVVIRPGDNDVPDDVLEVLKEKDTQFARHLKLGHLVVAANDEPKPAPAPAVVDPRVRLKGESDKAYRARMAKLDDEDAAAADQAGKDKAFLEAYDAMDEGDRKATYETLDDREKALVDGPRPQ